MYVRHTIKYNNLKDLFLLHSAWNGLTCLSWKDTLDIAKQLNIVTVPVLYEGIYDETRIKRHNDLERYNHDTVEGYVVRNSDEYNYLELDNNIAKFVSKRFQLIDNKRWYFNSVEKNELAKCN